MTWEFMSKVILLILFLAAVAGILRWISQMNRQQAKKARNRKAIEAEADRIEAQTKERFIPGNE